MIPLGQRIAVVLPGGATAVLEEQAVLDLGDELDDIFMTDAPGGLMKLGTTTGYLTASVMRIDPPVPTDTRTVPEQASVYLDTHAYSTRATLYPGSIHSTVTVSLDLDAVRALKNMFTDAERVMLGDVVPERPNNDTDDPDDAEAAEPEVRDSETPAQPEQG